MWKDQDVLSMFLLIHLSLRSVWFLERANEVAEVTSHTPPTVHSAQAPSESTHSTVRC